MTLAEEPAAALVEPLVERSFRTVFTRALRGHECAVVPADGVASWVPVDDWVRAADASDQAMLARCTGSTIDLGCGPGRLAEWLRTQGHVVLGIDVVHEAVGQTRDRGVSAVCRDVFGPLPGEGTWDTALLADGNVGIGGDPEALLRRAAEVVRPGGRVVVELEPRGVPVSHTWARLECRDMRSRPFRWSVVGVDGVDALAVAAGLDVHLVEEHAGRWWAVLTAPACRL